MFRADLPPSLALAEQGILFTFHSPLRVQSGGKADCVPQTLDNTTALIVISQRESAGAITPTLEMPAPDHGAQYARFQVRSTHRPDTYSDA